MGRYKYTWLLVVLAALLAGEIAAAYRLRAQYGELPLPPERPEATQTGGAPGGPPRLGRTLRPLTAYQALSDHNLFHPERRAVEDVDLQVDEGGTSRAPLPQDLVLVGIIELGDKRVAMIKSPSLLGSPRAMSFPEGAALGGYTVTRIEGETVLLEADGQETVLELRSFGGGPAEGGAPNTPTRQGPPPAPRRGG